MKWPSRRNSFPNGTVSCTSTAWNGERNFSNSRAERTKNAHSLVRYSVMAPGAMSSGCFVPVASLPGSWLDGSVIASSAPDRLEMLARGLERALERIEQPLRLVGIVGRVVALVDVDRHEPRFGPRVDRQMRFGEQHRAGDALGLDLDV